MKKLYTSTIIASLLSFLILCSCTSNKRPLTTAQIFGDQMVLQANKPINIWGTFTPNATITVLFRSQSLSIKADKNGKWKASLQPENYGTDERLIIKTKTDTLIFNDISVGEVWLCSGQSNMEMPVISNWAQVNNSQDEVSNADYPEIRLFTVEKNISFSPINTIVTKGWQACDSNSVKSFSASAYFFGRELYQNLKVPIGLIHSSWGGTVAEAWTSEAALLNLDDFAETANYINSLTASKDSLAKKYSIDSAQMMKEIRIADIGYDEEKALYAAVDINDSDWMPINLPKMWEETDLGVYDGSGWFRKTVEISEAMAKSELTLCYGSVDDSDEAWVNGIKVGEEQAWGVLRKYPIPEGVVKQGKNQITIRVYDYGGGGGFMNEAKDYMIKSSTGKSISIAKGWVVKKGFDFQNIETHPVSATDPNQTTVLYNAMINPLIPYSIQGAIWYQGESNSGRAHQYRTLFKTMVTDWRKQFEQGDFPFYFVQLANYLPRNTEPTEDAWAELREAQTMALELPNTGMAVTIDIGNALDIHPGNKQDVGKRLALNALAKTYKQNIAYMGPLYKSYKIKANSIEVAFQFNEGLSIANGSILKGFSISGSDSVFIWADAIIEGNKVNVSHPTIENPIAVRYAWSSNPDCNLSNATGLPASPFRTDNWKGITE